MFYILLCLQIICHMTTHSVVTSQLIDAKLTLIKNSHDNENLKIKPYVNKLKYYVYNILDKKENSNDGNLNELPKAEYENNDLKDGFDNFLKSIPQENQEIENNEPNDSENRENKPIVFDFFDNNQPDSFKIEIINDPSEDDSQSLEDDNSFGDESNLSTTDGVDSGINYRKIIVEDSDSFTTQSLQNYIEESKKYEEELPDLNEDNNDAKYDEDFKFFFKQSNNEQNDQKDIKTHLFSTTKGIVVFTVGCLSSIILITIAMLVVRKVLRNRCNKQTRIHKYETIPINDSEDEQLLS